MADPNYHPSHSLWKFLPLFLLILAIVLVYALGLNTYLHLETLRLHRHQLVAYVSQHYFLSLLAFIGSVILLVTLSIPADALLAVAAGFLFHQPLATFLIVISSTIGATLLFLVVRTTLTTAWRIKAAPVFAHLEKGFRRDSANYLLFLRFIPFSPFWFINLVAAFFNVPLGTFMWTTLVGIIPSAFVHTQAGEGLGAILDSGKPFSLHSVFNWPVILALIGLSLFSLVPIIVRHFIHHKS